MAAPKCAGCGADGVPFVGDVAACKPCGDAFIAVFGDGVIPMEGLAIPEGPVTKIADAILSSMGLPGPRQVEFIACRRPPRRRKLRR